MKCIFLFLLFSIPFTNCFSQLSIKGTVTDKDSKEPITAATVLCSELNKASRTDEKGSFEFSNLAKGTYNIQVSFIGYQTIVESVQLKDSSKTLNISIDKSFIEINEVVISGTTTSMQDESPLEIDVVKGSDIQKSGAVTATDALAQISGVSAITTGYGISRPAIRGLSGNRILVVSDGTRLENQQWDNEHSLGLSDFGVEQVEIIKGPASLLYGPEAIGGVVNFIEEQPASVGTISGDASYGFHSNALGQIYNAGIKGASDKINWSVRGGGRNFSDYRWGDTGIVANSRLGETNAKSSIGITKKWGSTSLDYQANKSFYDIVEANEKPGKETEKYPLEAEAPYHTVFYNKLTSKSNFFVWNSRLKTVFGFQNDQRAEFEPRYDGDKEGEAFLNMKLSSYTYDMKWFLPKMKNFSTIIGTQGMMQQNKNSGIEKLVPDGTVNDLGVMAISKYNHKKFNFEAGIRYDNRMITTEQDGIKDSADYKPAISKTFSNLSWSAGGTYDLEEHLLFRLNIANGYRAPNMVELLSNGFKPETQHYEKGNINFTTEKNIEADASAVIKSKHFSVEVSAFQNSFTNFIYLAPTDSIVNVNSYYHFLYEYRQQNAVLQGGEAGINIHPEEIKWIHLESKASLLSAKFSDGSYIPFMPPIRFNNSLIVNFRKWKKLEEVFVRFNVVNVLPQMNTAKYELQTNGYMLLNSFAGFSMKIWKLKPEFMIGCNNITNEVYFDHLSRLRALGIPNPGRSIIFNLKIPFLLKK